MGESPTMVLSAAEARLVVAEAVERAVGGRLRGLLTVDEAAAWLGVSAASVWRYVAGHGLRAIDLPGRGASDENPFKHDNRCGQRKQRQEHHQRRGRVHDYRRNHDHRYNEKDHDRPAQLGEM